MFCFMDGQYNWSMARCTTLSCAGSAGILSSCIELVGRIDVVAQFFCTIILPNSCISFFTGPLALCVMSLVMLTLDSFSLIISQIPGQSEVQLAGVGWTETQCPRCVLLDLGQARLGAIQWYQAFL